MSIAHELSCDVAAAMLAAAEGGQPGPAAGRDLTTIVLEVHTTLRRLTREARRRRLDLNSSSKRPQPRPTTAATPRATTKPLS